MSTGVSILEPLEPRLLLSSVTIITHGFNGNTQGWVSAMANAVAMRTEDPAGVSIATMTVANNGGLAVSSVVLNSGPDPFVETDSGDLILKLEWGQRLGRQLFDG